jgi:hypothetical protein
MTTMFPGMEYLSYNRTLIVVGNAHPTTTTGSTGKGEKVDRLTARGEGQKKPKRKGLER